MTAAPAAAHHAPDSRYAWFRLCISVLLVTVGSSGMYIVSTVLPEIQRDFGIDRSAASLPYTVLMIGFGVGGIVMGRLADRHGVMWPLFVSAGALVLGYIACGMSTGIVPFLLAQGLLVGLLGSGSAFGPLVADTSLWFVKRRGTAVGICASGNYLAGAIWPPVAQHFIETVGWRSTYIGIGIFCGFAMFGLALFMRPRPPAVAPAGPTEGLVASPTVRDAMAPFGFSLGTAQGLLCVASIACCVAMAMPQVHIVAYCGDLGYGAARGAEMLSLMLTCGVISRLASGWICDRIGGVRTLLLGSILQGLSLLLFLPFDGLVSLYVVSALFGLFQGGIVPSYAIIVREHFPPSQAGARVGILMMCTLLGMALGGWMSGKVFDLTGSYHAAFVNGTIWNLINLTVAVTLLIRIRGRGTGSKIYA